MREKNKNYYGATHAPLAPTVLHTIPNLVQIQFGINLADVMNETLTISTAQFDLKKLLFSY